MEAILIYQYMVHQYVGIHWTNSILFNGGFQMKRQYSKQKLIGLILIAFIISLCIITAALGYRGQNNIVQASDKPVNTPDYVVDDSVYIPEPKENKGRVPDHIRWEPMLGLYIVKDAYYDPETKSFIIPDHIVTPEPGDDESLRIDLWIKAHPSPDNTLYAGLIAYKKSLDENCTPSSLRLLDNNKVINDVILPLGIAYLDDMLDMVMNQKLFDEPLTYTIEKVAHVDCQPEGAAFCGYEQTHDIWRSNLKKLLSDVETAVIEREKIDIYGVFALPYLSESNVDLLAAYVVENSNFFKSNGFIMNNADHAVLWIADNKNLLDQIKFCVEKYR
jgi:hypothetical protein